MGQMGIAPAKVVRASQKTQNYFSGGAAGKGDAHVGSLAVDGVDFDLALVLRERISRAMERPRPVPPDSRLLAFIDAVETAQTGAANLLFGNADAVIRHADEDGFSRCAA